MQIKRLAMYEFNKPKIACNKCRDNKTNVQFNVIGRLEKLIQSEFKGNIPQSKSSTNFLHTQTQTTEQAEKNYKHLQTKRKYYIFGDINTCSVLMPKLDAVQLRFYLDVFLVVVGHIYDCVFYEKFYCWLFRSCWLFRGSVIWVTLIQNKYSNEKPHGCIMYEQKYHV